MIPILTFYPTVVAEIRRLDSGPKRGLAALYDARQKKRDEWILVRDSTLGKVREFDQKRDHKGAIAFIDAAFEGDQVSGRSLAIGGRARNPARERRSIRRRSGERSAASSPARTLRRSSGNSSWAVSATISLIWAESMKVRLNSIGESTTLTALREKTAFVRTEGPTC